MKIKQAQIDAALQFTREHYGEEDIHVSGGYRTMWGIVSQFSVTGYKGALEEFELYLATSILTPYMDDEVQAYALLKSIMDVRELRREDPSGYDDVVFYYPQFEVV